MPTIPYPIRAVIEFLKNKGYGARKIYRVLKRDYDYALSFTGVQHLLRKIVKHGTIDDLPRQGRPNCVCTLSNIEKARQYVNAVSAASRSSVTSVKSTTSAAAVPSVSSAAAVAADSTTANVASQSSVASTSGESTGASATTVSVTGLARHLQISRSSAHRILKRYLHMSCYKPFQVHRISEKTRAKRLTMSQALLDFYSRHPDLLKRTVFSDETNFSLGTFIHPQNQRIWTQATRKSQLADHDPAVRKTAKNYPQKFMVWAGFSQEGGKLPLIIFPVGTRLGGENYRKLVLEVVVPQMKAVFRDKPSFVFQQDGAPAHRAAVSMNYLREQKVKVLKNFPPNSPDLAVPDYFLFGYLKSKVYEKASKNLEELKARLLEEWEKLPQELIDKAVQEFPKRLEMVVREEGKQIQHKLSLQRDRKKKKHDTDDVF